MNQNILKRVLPALALLAAMLLSAPARATFHLWQISEIFSDASGNVQYVELSTFAGGQQFLSGHAITAAQGGATHSFTFPGDLPGDTAGRKFLVATQGFANLGIVTPDYVVPNGFLFLNNGAVNFAGVDSVSYVALPADGTHALSRTGSSVASAPTNFAGASGTMAPQAPAPQPNYQGLWWNPNESGWGMTVTQHRNMIFAAVYTYDAAGAPAWYVMSSCPLTGNSCTGDIYRVTGGTPPQTPWDGSGKVVAPVGTGILTFSDASNGTFNFTIDGVAGAKAITQQIFALGAAPPAVDYTDLWWNPNESGWGIALTQQFGMMFATWFTYDTSRKGAWYVASACPVNGAGCSGPLYRVTGGTPVTQAWNGANKVVTQVGTLTIAFSDANNGMMTYTIDGTPGARAITREAF